MKTDLIDFPSLAFEMKVKNEIIDSAIKIGVFELKRYLGYVNFEVIMSL